MNQIDITKTMEFTRGVARFTRIAINPKTGLQAWRRSYASAALDRVEIIAPERGRYYPEEAQIKRRIRVDDPLLNNKIQFYLEHGTETFYPGDDPLKDSDNN